MEKKIHLKTKTLEDSVLTTNHVLESLKQNTSVIYPKNLNRGMTVKEHDFMTYVFKALQVWVNDLNKTTVNEEGLQFYDLSMSDKIKYMKEHEPFFKIEVDEMKQFLSRTDNTNFRYVSVKDTFNFLQQIYSLSHNLVIATLKEDDNGNITGGIMDLFPYTSFQGRQLELDNIDINTFDLYINPYAYESILTVFNAFDKGGYGNTNIQILEGFRTVYTKNLWYFVSRYVNLIDTKQGFKVKLKTITDYLGISEQRQPMEKLKQIVKSFNKEMLKYNVQLIIEPVKTKNKITHVILKSSNVKSIATYDNGADTSTDTDTENSKDDIF